MKAPSPLLGFNNNVRHKGRLFHIQTEDSGIRHPHIITHLFADGGRILKTTKTSYAEHVGQASLAETVRGLMKEQHKAMFIALRDGHFDYLFDESAAPPPGAEPRSGRPSAPSSPEVGSAPRPAQATAPSSPDASAAQKPAPATAPSSPNASAAQKPAPATAPSSPDASAAAKAVMAIAPSSPEVNVAPKSVRATAPTLPEGGIAPRSARAAAPTLPEAGAAPKPSARLASTDAALRPRAPSPPAPPPKHAASPVRPAPASAAQPPRSAPIEAVPVSKRAASRPRLELDTEELHGLGAARSASAPSARVVRPAPAAERPAAAASAGEPSIDLDLEALERAAAEAQTPFFQQIQDLPPPPASVIGRRAESAPSGAGVYSNVHPEQASLPNAHAGEPLAGGAGSGRYASPRPASIFSTTRPGDGASIFGEDMISEKSLDEVILSYLAEDLDSPSEKK